MTLSWLTIMKLGSFGYIVDLNYITLTLRNFLPYGNVEEKAQDCLQLLRFCCSHISQHLIVMHFSPLLYCTEIFLQSYFYLTLNLLYFFIIFSPNYDFGIILMEENHQSQIFLIEHILFKEITSASLWLP